MPTMPHRTLTNGTTPAMSDEQKSKVDQLLEETETISKIQYRKETRGRGRSSEYEKFADLAENLEKEGAKKKVPEITESTVSSIRTQVEKLNHDDATKKAEKEFIATRRKITEDGEDVTDEDGNKLYNLYISRQEPTEDPSGGKQPSKEPEQQEVSENGTGGGKAEKAVG
jgi:hypothetical protein